ncbi:hypothetical protein AgCh_033939 [Apium graveolens]
MYVFDRGVLKDIFPRYRNLASLLEGKVEHEDGNILTFVLQDDVGGLEVLHNAEWIPVPPAPGTLVVNIGDTLQKSGIEPLPHFTTDIGEPPQYRGFYFKDFVQSRVHDRLNPPARLEDRFYIKHYAISTSG